MLTERLDAYNFEGGEHLDEKYRIDLNQQPHMMTNLIEPSEEVRIEYANLFDKILSGDDSELLMPFINFVIDIDRAFIMDPFRDVSIRGCKSLHRVCEIYTDAVKERGIYIIKALFCPMTNKNSKARIASIKAMGKLAYCNPFKQSYEIFNQIIGFRDPNVVPLKDFFEPTHKINYFA